MAAANFAWKCIFSLILIVNSAVTKSSDSANLACKQVGPCSCVQHTGSGIDISPLETFTTGGFQYLTASTNKVLYFYHPCADWPLHTSNVTTECSQGCSLCFFESNTTNAKNLNVSEVLSNPHSGTFQNLGYASQAVFQPSETDISIVFKPHKNVSVTIKLQCDEYAKTSTLTLADANSPVSLTHHELVLSSKYACMRNKNAEHSGMSGVSVFFLLLIIVASIYFFGGMLILRCIKGATGLEMIPNYDFWVSLPERVKNGCMTITGRDNTGPDSYERI